MMPSGFLTRTHRGMNERKLLAPASQARRVLRDVALAMNIVVLAPYALFVVVLAFSGDWAPWPTAAWGGLYLVAAGWGVVTLRDRGYVQLLLVGVCAIFQGVLLIRGSVEVVDKAMMISWPEQIMLRAPIIFVPALTLVALMLRERHWHPPLCPRCGYDLTGVSGQRCPECGHDQPAPASDPVVRCEKVIPREPGPEGGQRQ